MRNNQKILHEAKTKNGKTYRVEASTDDIQAWYEVHVIRVRGSFREIRNGAINTVARHNGRNVSLNVELTAADAAALQAKMDAYSAEHVAPRTETPGIAPMTLTEQAALDSGPDYSDDTVEGRLNNYHNGVAYDLHPMDPMAERIR